MKYKHILTFFVCIFLCACASKSKQQQQRYYSLTPAENSLAEASYSVSRSIVDLAETSQAAHPEAQLEPPPNPKSYGMDGVTSVDWSGPIEPLVKQIAKAANYRVNVLGTRPAIPVIVTVYAKNVMLGDILRDVGYQGGSRASVTVFPGSKLIEVRYAKN